MVPYYQIRHERQTVGLDGPDLAEQRRRALVGRRQGHSPRLNYSNLIQRVSMSLRNHLRDLITKLISVASLAIAAIFQGAGSASIWLISMYISPNFAQQGKIGGSIYNSPLNAFPFRMFPIQTHRRIVYKNLSKISSSYLKNSRRLAMNLGPFRLSWKRSERLNLR
jgi:hypothetical protein